jgi:GNAT superfamily N-acetyltransferase
MDFHRLRRREILWKERLLNFRLGCDDCNGANCLRARQCQLFGGHIFMPETTPPESIRAYRQADHRQVAALWARINRELAPADLREAFEQYIAGPLTDELRWLHDVFSPAKRNGFWVVTLDGEIIGTFGIESRSRDATELRRMYLDRRHRGTDMAQRMLQYAESRARALGFATMILSTAEIQRAALTFYRKNGYRLVKTEVAETMSVRTVGGGLKRFHFEKALGGEGDHEE